MTDQPASPNPSSPPILVEEHAAVGIITLNRPAVMNAIDLRMVEALRGLLDRLAREDRLACLILTGAGDRAFAAGVDVAELRERGREDALSAINSSLFNQLEQFPYPTIAAVRGYALGGGCELAMACDLRVAGRSARFGQPEVGLGIIAGAGALERLPKLVGLGRARELLFTGGLIDAERALEIGLVNQLVEDDQVLECARQLAGKIARQDRLALRLTKLSLSATARGNQQVGLPLDSVAQALCFESAEKRRRMTEFLERRKP